MPDRIAVLIGNGKFSPAADLPDLEGPPNDVEQLARVLLDADRGQFNEAETLIDREHHAVLSRLESRLRKAKRDDLFLVYYSGHGRRTPTGQLCLATADTDQEVLSSTSIPFLQLKQLTEESLCDNVVVVLDCCFSGAVAQAYGLKSSVEDQLQAVAQQTSGLHIFASSASYQVSLEREQDHGGGVLGNFTHCLIEGLRSGEADVDGDGTIRLSELRTYVQQKLRKQTAQYWGFHVHGDPVVAVNPQRLHGDRVQRARLRLAEWARGGHLPKPVFYGAVDLLRAAEEGTSAADEDAHLLELLTDDNCHPHHFLAAWEVRAPGSTAAARKVAGWAPAARPTPAPPPRAHTAGPDPAADQPRTENEDVPAREDTTAQHAPRGAEVLRLTVPRPGSQLWMGLALGVGIGAATAMLANGRGAGADDFATPADTTAVYSADTTASSAAYPYPISDTVTSTTTTDYDYSAPTDTAMAPTDTVMVP